VSSLLGLRYHVSRDAEDNIEAVQRGRFTYRNQQRGAV
jgi:hypothetical protein